MGAPVVEDKAARDALRVLLAARSAIGGAELDWDDPDYAEAEAARRVLEVRPTAEILTAYAAATGRCADHLRYAEELDAGRPCRNRAKSGGLCGVHAPHWELELARAEARLAGQQRLRANRGIADRFRAHGIAATVGAEHLVVPIADAVAIADLLDRADTALANERFETARRIDRDDDYSEEALDRDAAQEDDACPDDPDGLHHAGCGCEDVDPVDPNGGGS